jgi:hypothetical protein
MAFDFTGICVPVSPRNRRLTATENLSLTTSRGLEAFPPDTNDDDTGWLLGLLSLRCSLLLPEGEATWVGGYFGRRGWLGGQREPVVRHRHDRHPVRGTGDGF